MDSLFFFLVEHLLIFIEPDVMWRPPPVLGTSFQGSLTPLMIKLKKIFAIPQYEFFQVIIKSPSLGNFILVFFLLHNQEAIHKLDNLQVKQDKHTLYQTSSIIPHLLYHTAT